MINLEELSDNDAYSLLFVLMGQLNGREPYSCLSELSYILDKESFLKFISYYGGTTITVPTADEFHKASRVLVLYHSYITKSLPWHESIKLAGYESEESVSAKLELRHFQRILELKNQ